MKLLTKDTVVSYLREHVSSLELGDDVQVSQIGDGSLGADVEGDGKCNYVFRVSDGIHSYIVKQSSENLRNSGRPMTADRNRFEYDIMKLRGKIIQKYVPVIYHGDPENHLFVMEDVSYLKLIRFQMAKNYYYPNLPTMISEYLAATHFYTSEFFLECTQFRQLIAHFMNPEERNLCEDLVFLEIFGASHYDTACGPEFEAYCESIRYNPKLQFQRYKLRQIFQSKCECLIHGDFHTSNIFADDDHLKVIDMEYTFGAPFSYDLGFIISMIISQYSASVYRPFESETEHKRYMAYLLSVIELLYTEYIRFFFEYWDKDAKLEYQLTPCYKDSLALDILREAFGFAACYNFARTCGDMTTEEFDSIKENDLRTKAKFLSINIDAVLFEKWYQYESVDEIINDIIQITKNR